MYLALQGTLRGKFIKQLSGHAKHSHDFFLNFLSHFHSVVSVTKAVFKQLPSNLPVLQRAE